MPDNQSDIVISGSRAASKIGATQDGTKAAGFDPSIIAYGASSHGNPQPFGALDGLKCADNRAKECLNLFVAFGKASGDVYGLGMQTTITHRGFDDTRNADGVYEGFLNNAWRQAAFYDRTAIVLLEKRKDGGFNRVTVWSTEMERQKEFVQLSAIGGEITNLDDEKEIIEGGFALTVSEIMTRTKSDDGPWLSPSKKQDPNAVFDKHGRTRQVVLAEAVQHAFIQMDAAKKQGDESIDLAFALDYVDPKNDMDARTKIKRLAGRMP